MAMLSSLSEESVAIPEGEKMLQISADNCKQENLDTFMLEDTVCPIADIVMVNSVSISTDNKKMPSILGHAEFAV